MLNTTASYQLIARDMTRSLSRTANSPVVARETEYYLANITKVQSIEDFLGNDRVFAYAMKAFGLEEMTYAKAFMRKALEGGIDDDQSFANKLSDRRYREFVEAFNFVRYGEAATAFDRTQQGTVDLYLRQTLEITAGDRNQGVRLALYFERKAPEIGSVYQILADPALLQVVQTALGIPASTGAANIDVQAKMISARLDVGDLKDPEALGKFLERFTSLWELGHPSAAALSPAMLVSQPIEAGIGPDLLMALQGLKIGGL
ncbi:MAG TPA: DUF1217 domain-containing protein [Propylenella sp.]|nr:DUF1217 domain-containing protein [Propylenella sp.]